MLIFYIVIIIHGIFWLKILPEPIGSLLLFEMPAIFVISGYAYYLFEQASPRFNQHTLHWKDYAHFVLVRAFRLLFPYFVYVIVCIVMIDIYGRIQGDETILLHKLAVQWLNPFVYGGDDQHSMLDNHLWFVHVFLLVTLAMPVVTQWRWVNNPNLFWVIAIIATLLFVLSLLNFMREETIKHSLYYLCFSMLGYHLGRSKAYFEKLNFIKIGVFCGLALLALSLVSQDIHMLYMQLNKFPPNHIFFLFNCIWMSVFLHITFKYPTLFNRFNSLQHSAIFKPFMQYGYSIYLWQGIGYSLAVFAGKNAHLPVGVVWLLAIGLSVLLGCMFGPLEKIRLKRKTV
jgi:peptidoglycan/LPS O-acetylase OafA/YrhL